MRATENSSRKTIDKALRVLTAFSSAEPELTIGELAERLHLHKSVVSRVVSSLRDWRMLEKDRHTQKVRIGENAFRIGSLYALHDDLSRISKPRMEELVAKTEQSSHVTVLDRHQILVVATVDSPNALRVIMRLGERRSLHSTAAGKLFLAMTKDLLDAVLAKRIEAFTPETITSPTELRKAVDRVRRDRLAWNLGESSVGAGAVAAPILDRAGQIIAALSTVYPLNVADESARQKIGRATAATARSISRELGYSP
jgi:DNA-binding IclR family transcriptional regulator